MERSSISSLSRVAIAICVCFVFTPQTSAEINFDKLNACEGVAQIYESLETKELVGCTSARNALSKALLSRLADNGDNLCIERFVQANFLEGFTCFRFIADEGSALTCFKPASSSDIRAYKQNYGSDYAEKAARYRKMAASCPISNGDAAVAQNTLFSPLLTTVSRFEFGSIMGLGRRNHSNSAAVHGYASVDPDIEANVPAAIEFVEIFVNRSSAVPRDRERQTVGEWSVEIDDADKFDREISQRYLEQNVRVKFDSRSFTLQRRSSATLSMEQKKDLIVSVQESLGAYLEDEGFTEFTEDDLEETTGMSMEEVLDNVSSSQPYALRGVVSVLSFLVYVNETNPRCASRGGGAIAAYISSYKPTPKVKSDYGEITLTLAGIGDCARGSMKSTRRYFSSVLDEASSELLASLPEN